jgi:Skp family chaperone for outer membrane proteins
MKIILLFLVLLALPAVLLSSENAAVPGISKTETKIISEIDRYYHKNEATFDESGKNRFKNKYNELMENRRTKLKQLRMDLKNKTYTLDEYKNERLNFLQNQESELKVEGMLLQNCCLKTRR